MLGFPVPYQDELLYSTIARYGIHSGIVSPKELLLEVFGDSKILATSDLPSHLKSIAALYPETLKITPEHLLYQHTLFPLYAPFVGDSRRETLVHELTANDKSSAYLMVGAAASRIKQPKSLRYCPGCIHKQLMQYGECYWRRGWQIVGVESCPAHGALVNSQIRRHDVHRHQFLAANLDACPSITQQAAEWQSDLLAQSIYELLNVGPMLAPELPQWSLWYANLAADHQCNRGSQIRHNLVRDKVVGFWGADWLDQYGLVPDDSEANWLRSMFRKHRKAFSYLEHLVVLHAFLRPEWKVAELIAFVAGLKMEQQAPKEERNSLDKQQLEIYRHRWLDALESRGVKKARLNGFGDVYAWLYRRDRQWLIGTNRAHTEQASRHYSRVCWHQRDLKTVKQLITIQNQSELRLQTPRRSRNWYLNQVEHKTSIEKHLDQLPLCRLFIDRYCESISEYQIRRITRAVIALVRDEVPLKRWQVLRMSGLSEGRLTLVARRFLMEILKI